MSNLGKFAIWHLAAQHKGGFLLWELAFSKKKHLKSATARQVFTCSESISRPFSQSAITRLNNFNPFQMPRPANHDP